MQFTLFTVFQCDVCKRQIELENNSERPDPRRCIITNKCTGHLLRVAGRNSRSELFPPVVIGLQDYIQRGSNLAQRAVLQPVETANLLTADDQMTMGGVLKREFPVSSGNYFWAASDSDDVVVDLEATTLAADVPTSAVKIRIQLFELTPSILNYRQYTYNRGTGIQAVRGSDDTPDHRVLRFVTTDRVEVFVNGIQLTETQFDRTVDDVVTFTPLLTDSSNVIQAFVFQDIDVLISNATLIPINFSVLNPDVLADIEQRSVNAWGDVLSVAPIVSTRMLMFSENLGDLTPGKQYGVARVDLVGPLIPAGTEAKASDLRIVLATDPFAFEDKNLYSTISLFTLIDEDAALQFTQDISSGKLSLTVAESLVTTTFERFEIIEYVDSELLTNANQDETSNVATPIESPFILGPS